MFTSIISRHSVFSLPRIIFCAALLVLLPLAVANAQGVGAGRDITSGGTGGSHIIQGRIIFPVKPPEGTHIKVRLEEPNAGSLSSVTDADYAFRFSNLNAGYYTLIVDAGNEYEVVRESVAIDKETSSMPRVITVPVYLRPKGSGPAGAANPALAGVPKPAVDLYQKGLEAAQKGDSKKAIEQLSKAVELHPQFALALNELGVQYLKQNQADKAAESLATAVKLMPDEFTPHLNYGIALLNLKKLDEAEVQLKEAVKKNDTSPTAHMYLGITLMSQKKFDEAKPELEKAVSSNSNEVAMAHRYLGGLYWGERDYKRAADELETYLKLVPKAPDAEKTKAAIKDLRSKQ